MMTTNITDWRFTSISPPIMKYRLPLAVRRTNHLILFSLLAMLEERELVDAETGEIVPEGSEAARKLIREAGWSKHSITGEIVERTSSFAGRPRWRMRKRVPKSLLYQLTTFDPATKQRRFNTEEDETFVFDNMIVEVPNFILNACLCQELRNRFPRVELRACPGFIEREGCLRLDLDDHLSQRGFMMPVIETGLIQTLRVFRYPQDTRPFILKSRILNLTHYA
jgi:hypothetical protein